jgi:hypothetical protein
MQMASSHCLTCVRWLILAGVLFLMPDQSIAHDWYHKECCLDDDCRPARPGEVIPVPDGWSITSTDQTFPAWRARPSKDGEFHVCQWLNPYLDPPRKILQTRCIYVPAFF